MSFLSAATDLSKGFQVSEALQLSVLGFAIVFFVLVMLMAFIKIITGIHGALTKGKTAEPLPAVAAVAPAAAPAGNLVPAPGSLGDIDLHSVDDATAAMLMAIVADELQTPLNELRFTSIRELGKE